MYLRLKTDHSLLESTLQIEKAIQLTKEAGLSFFATTENGHFASIAQSYAYAKKMNLKYVAAVELRLNVGSHTIPLVVVCQNTKAYQQLLVHHTRFQTEVDFEFVRLLQQYDVHIIPVITLAQKHYVEFLVRELSLTSVGIEIGETLQSFDVEQLQQIEAQYQVAFCLMNEVCMERDTDTQTVAVLQAIKQNSRQLVHHKAWTNAFLSRTQNEQLVHAYPALLTRVEDLVKQTDFELIAHHELPQYPFVPEDVTSDLYLRNLVLKGATRRYQNFEARVVERIEHELTIIQELGFADYFLILWDAKRYAYQNDILFGPGRGSAVGSIVSYCLGITEIDPLRYQLVFERFLNKGRKSYPDIDIDVADDKREQLIGYLKQRYGQEHVAHILTYGTFGSKSAFREVARISEIPPAKITEVTRHFGRGLSLAQAYRESKGLQRLLERDDALKRCYTIALKIEGLKRNMSTHAAGIIITDSTLMTMMPVFDNGGLTTGWEMKELEQNGFLKIDFLGLKNLSILDTIEQMIVEYNPTFQMREIPLEDPKTYQLLSHGLTDGIFQLESKGIQNVLRLLKPNQFEDIVAVIALYRPGPMDNIPLFVERKEGRATVEMLHEDLRPILSETHGVIVYQEQIMQIVHTMAHFDFVQADDFRRAISKKDETLLRQSLGDFENAARHNGYDDAVVQKVSHLMLQFANYGFVKGHAVAYSLIAYRLMYMKTHFPQPFYATLLNHHLQDTTKLLTYVSEMKRRHITLLPIDIVLSDPLFKNEKKDIRMGLCSIKGIGLQTAKQMIEIVSRSAEKTAIGLIRALLQQNISKEQLRAIIAVGGFDRFQETRQTLIQYMSDETPTDDYSHLNGLVELERDVVSYPEYSIETCEQFERDYLGYPFFQNMFMQFEKAYDEGLISPLHVIETHVHGVYQTVARIVSVRQHQNGTTQFIKIADNVSELSAVSFDATILEHIAIQFGEIYHMTIKCSRYKEKPSYQIIKVAPIAQ